MTLTEAKEAIRIRGVPFDEAFAQVEEHNREALKAWYVTAEGVPNLVARSAQQPQWFGEMCKCGGMMIQTGSCKTCQSCGTSSGGCG